MNIHSLIEKIDSKALIDIIEPSVYSLVKLLNQNNSNQDGEHTYKNFLNSIALEDWITQKKLRDFLIDQLSIKQASILAQILNVYTETDIYGSLKSCLFEHGSEEETDLFNFFEIAKPKSLKQERDQILSYEKITPNYPLFEHQIRASIQVKEYLNKFPYRVLLHMPTGSGKTRTAMNIICDHLRSDEHRLVVWLAYSEELCEQAVTEFQKAWNFLGNRPICVYRFWGDHDLNLTEIRDGLIVAGLSKIYNKTKRSIQFINRLGSRCSLVIIDEAHQSIAETYSLVLDALVIPYEKNALLGLTATPGRTWNDVDQDEKLSRFFSKNKVTLAVEGYDSPVDYLVDQQYLAKTHYRSLFYDSGVELSPQDLERINEQLEIPSYILKQLEEDHQRNLCIICELEKLTKIHNRIIFFAISVYHANVISTVLKIRGFFAELITGETSKYDRNRIIKDFKNNDTNSKILCNYGVLTTGFDAPKTSAAVIGRPTKSLVLYSQMVGRAIRGVKAGGNATAEIITVVDNQLPGFGSVTEAFHNWEDVWRQHND